VDDKTKALYRRALGAFPTGVAVVTVDDGEGGAVGLTVNSFTSVSLDPRLVAWSLGLASDRGTWFRDAERFVINILGAEGADLAAECARRGHYRLDPALIHRTDPAAPPGVQGALSRLTCRTHQQVKLGDHLLIVGEVTAFESGSGDALTYFRGRYGRAFAPEEGA
jgi:3-hydroxy-9,10-secoandrosta-1,3,5(10)-triene-9,17-dione monooxygenase reductase component